MNNLKKVNLGLFLLSACVLCFEIIATRISSVIFVSDYAFFILSLSILGIGSGGVFSYLKIKTTKDDKEVKIISNTLFAAAVSILLFILAVTEIEAITNPFVFFFLLFIPFFLAGIVYSQIFKIYLEFGFKLYAADLTGAAAGSILSLTALNYLGAPNGVLLIIVLLLITSVIFGGSLFKKWIAVSANVVLILSAVLIIHNGRNNIFGIIPIGNFPEKDFHHVYPDPSVRNQIIDSRWSVYGRADLVEYSHQNVVKHIFVDGAAGTQMYRFSGNVKDKDRILLDLLVHQSSSIPFLFLNEEEKNNMLIIGPGGGKEVLIGLFENVDHITGVEINPDFVELVKDYKYFNGGIYTDFPNVEILVKEGRHFIKQSKTKYDLIVMALPSTEQMQSIEAFAMNENYLLTVEALKDYLNILTGEGRLIFTVHNQWELGRLITTTIEAFNEIGINTVDALNHFAILESEFSPTIVIKKNAFSKEEISRWQNIVVNLPNDLPAVTYLPYNWNNLNTTIVNRLMIAAKNGNESLTKYIKEHPFDISACRDDSPYFYKTTSGIPKDFVWFLAIVAAINILVITLPLLRIKKNIKQSKLKTVTMPLLIFICIGLGFMILEISMFQKLILYLGAPTISLSILLCAILVGMGIGSFSGNKLYNNNPRKRLIFISISIVITGSILFLVLPIVLEKLLAQSLIIRALTTIAAILPFGFLLGMPFPTTLQLLKETNDGGYVPWMYGVNGTMSVLSSILVVSLSMITGFTPAFFIGLCFYAMVFFIIRFSKFGVIN